MPVQLGLRSRAEYVIWPGRDARLDLSEGHSNTHFDDVLMSKYKVQTLGRPYRIARKMT